MKSIALSLLILVLIGAAALVVAARSSRRAPARSPAPVDGRLAPCPDTPNCVSSQDDTERARIDPFELGDDPIADFAELVDLVAAQSGAELGRRDETYAHVIFRTRVFGFVDDVELLIDADEGVAHVRSASRVGHSDLGANRARVERLRAGWGERRGR